MIKTVLIDIDDTLLDFDLCAEWSMNCSARDMGLDLPEHAFPTFTRVNSGLWRELEQGLIAPEVIYDTRWNRIFAELGAKADGHAFEKRFLHYLEESIEAVPGAMDLLQYLSGKYQVYAASNGPYGQQLGRMKNAGMSPYLKDCFVSERAGHSKPKKGFFDYCLREMEEPCELDEMMMIGDSLTADIRGARDYGLKTCWFNKHRKKEYDPDCADYIVESLGEIKEIL